MKIIDSQIHCFYPNTPERPWPEGATSPHGPQYTIEQALEVMDANGVQAAVLVPPSWNGWDNQYSLDAAVAQPTRFGVMGRFDITLPDAQDRLRRWRDQPGMLGVRVFLVGEPWMRLIEDDGHDWFWAISAETALPVMSTIPGNIAAFGPVLERHPTLRLIIDHAGRHPRGPKDDAAWDDVDQLHALAKFENVSVKVSSLPSFTTQGYPFEQLHPHVRRLVESFGPERLLWGSDVTRLDSTYDENIRLFTEALDFLSEDGKSWIMGRAAMKALDWQL